MKIFKRKKIPIRRTEVIRNIVKKFTLTVRNFKKGSAIKTVSVRISKVAAKYRPLSGRTTPISKRLTAKNINAKYAIRDFKKFFIFLGSHML